MLAPAAVGMTTNSYPHKLTCLKPSVYRGCLIAMLNDQADREVCFVRCAPLAFV